MSKDTNPPNRIEYQAVTMNTGIPVGASDRTWMVTVRMYRNRKPVDMVVVADGLPAWMAHRVHELAADNPKLAYEAAQRHVG